MDVKTRFAPSPTGALHIGSVRTALYAFLWAKKNKGTFALRIEDTDRNRLVEGSVEDIIEILKWLGLEYDEGPTLQSERKDIYQKYANQLVQRGLAYESDGAIWFKTTKEGKTKIKDLVGVREIEFDNSTQADFVLVKSDGFPTYHLAHVVDDYQFKTNPVIRGAEWISSIPKHVMLFEAFGWEVPQYAHLPIILGSDKSKLSKRHGAKPASEFRKDGFLPEAILNYMALLGWSPKSGKELLSIKEMVEEFDLKEVNLANPVFDIKKLEWINGEYIRKSQNPNLKAQIYSYLQELSEGKLEHPTEEEVGRLVPLVKERIKKLSDFIPLTDFIFEEPEYEKEVFLSVANGKDVKMSLEEALKTLESLERPWKAEEFENSLRELSQSLGLSVTQMFQLIRVSISGQTVTPPLFETIKILGEEEVFKRVNRALLLF